MMNTNPTVELLGRYNNHQEWYVISTYSYKNAMLMVQEDPMNRKIGEVIWPSTPDS